MKRMTPEPPPGPPMVVRNPGMADELWREIAPLLAQDGILEGQTVSVEVLQEALGRAVERRNMMLFSPVGPARRAALTVLTKAVTALHTGDTTNAAAVLDAVEPAPADATAASVAGCIGVAVSLLDEWLGGRHLDAPAALPRQARVPTGRRNGEQAATDLIALARKVKAFASLQQVIARQGGQHVLFGSPLALTGALAAWADLTGAAIGDVTRSVVH